MAHFVWCDNIAFCNNTSHLWSETVVDRLTSLRVFIDVAATGSLSGAARALNMSQTMATKHVAALEQHLGVKLFHRSTRRLSLTEAGRNYLESSERILADLDAADSAVSADRFEPRGILRVNAPVSFGARQIAPMIDEFTRRHPHLSVELGLNDRQVDLADEGWDLAVRIGTLESSALVARKLTPCRTVIAAAPGYLKAHGTPKRVAELSTHNCLGYTLSRMAGADRWPFGPKGEALVQVSGNLRSNNGDALRAAAVAGQGIIYQPTFIVADDLRAGTLVALHLDRPTYEFGGIYAVYLPDRNPPAKLRAFIDFLTERLGPVPPWDQSLPVQKLIQRRG
jgi:DNA-binding transcriptional LysR family regulator